jgi:hypothetical protein
MARWGEIPNMSTEQELISLNKKLISTAKELKALQDNLSKSNLGLSQVVDDNELAIIEIEQSIQALNSIKVKKRRLISLLSGDE